MTTRFHRRGLPTLTRQMLRASLFLVLLFTIMSSRASVAQTIKFVQVNSSVTSSGSTMTAAFTSTQTAANLNIVTIGWSDATNSVTSVSDSKGNSYKLAVSYASASPGITQAIYYASNIVAAAAGANTVTVKLSASVSYPDLRVAEYAGVSTLDKTASAGGTAAGTVSSGAVTTTASNELLFGSDYTFGTTSGPGSGYTSRTITTDSDIVEDEIASSAGSYSATAKITGSGAHWVMQLATFSGGGGGGGCTAVPSAPTGLAAANTTSTGTSLSWTAVTPPANCSISSYTVLQNGTTIGTATGTSFAVTGLTPSTSYSFTVKATDADGTSAASSPLSVTTSAANCTAVPSAPTGLAATNTTTTSTSLSWTAVTPPANCSISSYTVLQNGTSIGTATSTSFAVTGLSPSTTYSLTVKATDADGTSAASSPLSVTTSAASCTTLPSAPTGLAAANTTSTGTSLSWAAVTPPANCSISSYTILEGGNSIGSATGPSFAVTGLSPSNTYSFTVEATDADGTSAPSSAVNVTTLASSGATFYVSPTGNDLNPGTSSSAPWLTISHAAATVTGGDTVLVGAGTYHEAVTITTTGTSTAPIIFNGQGVAIVDGTGVTCCVTPTFTLPPAGGFGLANTQGLFTLGNTTSLNYVTVEGFTIQNFKTSSNSNVPAGILIGGGGTGIQILNNIIQNIQSTAGASANAYGIAVFGTSSTPLSVTVNGNTVTGCLTGQSETTTYNGNVQDFVVSNNIIHGNDNIGMDAIGFEGVGPTGSDQAKNGDVFGNVIYNNSAANNAAEGSKSGSPDYDEDGVYCDGCTQVVFERNTLYGNDFGAEAASECTGEVSSYVIIRDNLIYGNNAAGVTLGGYNSSTGSGCAGGGSSDHIYILNNTLYNNSTQSSGASGELQTQFRITNSYFENNIVYTGSAGLFILNQTSGAGMTLNNNDYYTTSSTPTWDYNGTAYTSFSLYKTASGENNSINVNPGFITLPSCTGTYTPTGGSGSSPSTTCSALGNTDITSSSQAFNTGNSGLGTPSGSGYSMYETSEPFVGKLDFNNNSRVNSSGQINIGAYEQ